MITCICTERPPAPYDHLVLANPKCIAHHPDVRLVAAGWERNGSVWTHPTKRGLWTRDQAMDALEQAEVAAPQSSSTSTALLEEFVF